MKFIKLQSCILVVFTLFFVSCSTEESAIYDPINSNSLTFKGNLKFQTNYYDNQGPHEHNFTDKRADGFTEGFESGKKDNYPGGIVSISSGSWYLQDALLGTSNNDKKFGRQSVRIRNTGYATMSFDVSSKVRSVNVRHAKYGKDGSSTWSLIVSYDGGNSWFYAGDPVTTKDTNFNTVNFNVNESKRARYGIYKTGGGRNRINIDNFEISTGGSTTNNGTATRDSNIAFGNPSNAGTTPTNYLLSKPDYTMSYNSVKGTANWVSWHLSKAWRGRVSRCNCFEVDRSLPSNFFKVASSDYKGSGFDRGHLCASADRTYSSQGNGNTFVMTNIAPQAADNNQKSWADFENYLRSLLDDNEIYIISGVAGSGGVGKNGFARSIARGAVTVPDSFWKIALIMPNGADDINRVSNSTRVLAINVPNDQNISTNWRDFLTSINAIENLTGYDFYENIPNSIESVLEARIGN